MEENSYIVPTNIPYTSCLLMTNIEQLKKKYSFLKSGVIGYSVLGKTIPYIKLGNGFKEVLYSASFHANEWITSTLLMKFVENYCIEYERNGLLYSYNVKELFNNVSIYIVPMINPDGVDLVTGAIKEDTGVYNNFKDISLRFPYIRFPLGWKANFNGVDLNLQFPAEWNMAREIKYSQGFNKPAPRDFVGFGPLTEPEALSIYNFTLIHNFNLILAYHSQGEVIYWQFQNYNPPRSKEIGEQLSISSGYYLEETPYNSSFAGFKDWFIQDYNKPGYTIEVGYGENPLPLTQFEKIYDDNIGILILSAIL
jgi:g-D-glutamyl-meso-diaminopimelate peptidase